MGICLEPKTKFRKRKGDSNMERFKLVTPEEVERELIARYFNELSNKEAEVHGQLNLKRFSTNGSQSYDCKRWLETVKKACRWPNTDETVPTETMFLVREYTLNYGAKNLLPNERIVGLVTVRLALNYNLFNSNGHISVSLAPHQQSRLKSEEIALYLTLNLLKKRNIAITLVTPEVSGVSEEACVEVGGKLLHRHFDDQHEREIKRYAIMTDTKECDDDLFDLVAEWPE